MLHSRRGMVTGWLAVCMIAGGVAVGGFAQPATKPSEKGVPAPATKVQPESQPPDLGDSRTNAGPLISVEFPGGTVAEYIDALRQAAAPEPVNAVVSEPASKVRLAPIRLRKVALETSVQSIETAAIDAGNWRISRVRLERRDRDPLAGEAPVFSILFEPLKKRDAEGRPAEGAKRLIIQVYSLRDITDPISGDPSGVPLVQKPETVLTAIRSAIELSVGSEPSPVPELKYHQESGLLIVRGTAEQTGLVQQTISTMESDVRQRRSAALQMGMSGVSVADLRAQVEKASLMAMKLEAEAKRAAEALPKIKSQAEFGTVNIAEVSAAEAHAQNAQFDARMAQVEVARLAEKLRSLEDRDGPGGPVRPAEGGPVSRPLDLSAWGDKADAGAAVLAKALERASESAGKEHGASVRYDPKARLCIVVAEPWGQDLARRVLGEYARANGLVFDGTARPGADGSAAGRTEGGGGKKK